MHQIALKVTIDETGPIGPIIERNSIKHENMGFLLAPKVTKNFDPLSSRYFGVFFQPEMGYRLQGFRRTSQRFVIDFRTPSRILIKTITYLKRDLKNLFK